MDSLFSTQFVVQITCAEPEYLLTRIRNIGVTVRNVNRIDAYKMEFRIDSRGYASVQDLIERCGGKISVIQMHGPAIVLRFIKERCVFVCSIILLILLTIYIPSRIFFISVEGNKRLTQEFILQYAEECGLSFGAIRKTVRSEMIKNALLQGIPDLKWVGINTYGCHAVISVLERDWTDDEIPMGVGGIYATRDGIISNITALKGTPLCCPGQAVSAGQLLISGYTDTGFVVRAELAEGEVRAVTQHQITGFSPCYSEIMAKLPPQKSRWSLKIGKKRLNLYFNSGNFDTGCGKINKIYVLTLPGGFELPISLIKETEIRYIVSDAASVPREELLEELLHDYLSDTMIAGRVLKATTSVSAEDGLCTLKGKYICEEMIGKLQYRESE